MQVTTIPGTDTIGNQQAMASGSSVGVAMNNANFSGTVLFTGVNGENNSFGGQGTDTLNDVGGRYTAPQIKKAA